MEIYLYRADQQTGPYTEAEARALVASSQITRGCLTWHEGLSEWLPLEAVISLPAPPVLPPVPAGLPPVPPRNQVPLQTAVAPATGTGGSSTIRTVSGVIALLLGLLAIFNIGGCVNAKAKLAQFQHGPEAGVDMLVDTARGINQGDPLRGLSDLLGTAHSLQADYEDSQLYAWLCLIGTAVAGSVFRFSAPSRTP